MFRKTFVGKSNEPILANDPFLYPLKRGCRNGAIHLYDSNVSVYFNTFQFHTATAFW